MLTKPSNVFIQESHLFHIAPCSEIDDRDKQNAVFLNLPLPSVLPQTSRHLLSNCGKSSCTRLKIDVHGRSTRSSWNGCLLASTLGASTDMQNCTRESNHIMHTVLDDAPLHDCDQTDGRREETTLNFQAA